jgi:LacI family transcriptional regulator
LRGVASALSKANYELVIYPVDSMEHLQGYLSSIPLMRNIDGLIIMSLSVGDQDAERLSRNGMETVLIEYSHPQLNSIVINDELGGQLAAKHLISKGHKAFGFLGDIEPPEKFIIHPVRSRLTGFKQVLQEAGLSLSKAYTRSAAYTKEESKQAALELLSLPEPPTAIFVGSDIQALSVMKVARQLKIKIPSDLAVIGFDDIDVAEHLDLTTICQHLDESGRLAAEILLARISEPNRPLQHINLPLNLIERLTT